MEERSIEIRAWKSEPFHREESGDITATRTPQIFTFSPPRSPKRESPRSLLGTGTWSDSSPSLPTMDSANASSNDYSLHDTTQVEGSDEDSKPASSSLPTANSLLNLYAERKPRGRSISVPPFSSLDIDGSSRDPTGTPSSGYGLLSPCTSSSTSVSPREEKSTDASSDSTTRGRNTSASKHSSVPASLAFLVYSGMESPPQAVPAPAPRQSHRVIKPNDKNTKRSSGQKIKKHKSDTNNSHVRSKHKHPNYSDHSEDTPSVGSYSSTPLTTSVTSVADLSDTQDSSITTEGSLVVDSSDSDKFPILTGSHSGSSNKEKKDGKRNIIQRGQKLVRSKSRSTSPHAAAASIKKTPSITAVASSTPRSETSSTSTVSSVLSETTKSDSTASPTKGKHDGSPRKGSPLKGSPRKSPRKIHSTSASPSETHKSRVSHDIPELQNSSLRDIIYFYVYNPQDKFALQRFIFAHGHFFTSQKLLKELTDVYKKLQPIDSDGKLTFRLVNILKCWLDVSYSSMPAALRHSIHEFISYIASCNPNLGEHLTNVIERLRNKANILAQNSEPVNRPPPLSPMKAKRSPKHVWKISEFNDLELARQLCLIEHDFLIEISEKDLHNLNWTSKSKSKVLEYADFSNKLVAWLLQQIVEDPTPKGRAKVVCHILKISENYNSMLAIFLALASPSIHNDPLWKYVPKKSMNIKENILSIVSPMNNFKGYRSHIKNLDPPMIPCQECMLKDIIFLVEGSVDFIDEEKTIINVKKLEQLGFYIQFIFQCKEKPYNFHIEPTIFATITYGIKHVEIPDIDDGSQASPAPVHRPESARGSGSGKHSASVKNSDEEKTKSDEPISFIRRKGHRKSGGRRNVTSEETVAKSFGRIEEEHEDRGGQVEGDGDTSGTTSVEGGGSDSGAGDGSM